MRLIKVIAGTLPASAVIAFSPFMKVNAKECHECHVKRLPKANELPLYGKNEDNLKVDFIEEPQSFLETEVSVLRKHFSQYISTIDVVRKRAVNIYETGLAHSQNTYEYLADDVNLIPRVLTIASGGFAGLLLARKGGIFKRVVYSSAGIIFVSAAFYPKLAKDYALRGYHSTTDNVNQLLVNYGGYDTEKISAETKDKMESLKKTLQFEGLTNKLKEWFYRNKHSSSEKQEADSDSSLKNEKSVDQDLYTTRSRS